nr:MAG TPA: hypothetical protein [Caudoviricetes sp.]
MLLPPFFVLNFNTSYYIWQEKNLQNNQKSYLHIIKKVYNVIINKKANRPQGQGRQV